MAAELQKAVEDEARAHAVADQRDGAVAVGPAHEDVRQQDARLLRPVKRHRPCMVYHLRRQPLSSPSLLLHALEPADMTRVLGEL